MKKLGVNQRKILNYLCERAQGGVPPSVREICEATEIKSTSTVHAHLKTLEQNGYISRESGLNRAIHICGTKTLQVPIINDIRFIKQDFSPSKIDGYVSYIDSGEDSRIIFATKMPDDSMNNIGILKGDIVIALKTEIVDINNMVVALHNNKPVVRYFKLNKKNISLTAENPYYPPIPYKDTLIIGKVLSTVRYY